MNRTRILNDVPGRVSRRARKTARIINALAQTPFLASTSRLSHRQITDSDNETVVSMTSYGARLETVHLTIESIARGRSRPGRLILWTDPNVELESLPTGIQRLRARGLEVMKSPERLGPHTKYFPYVASQQKHDRRLVTADDDSIYPRRWLQELEKAANSNPGEINCFRAHQMRFEPDGAIAPYNSWGPVEDTQASQLHFATGVSGVIYPPAFLGFLAELGTAFLSKCPRADDVWLHFAAVVDGRRIRQISARPRKFPEVMATQRIALHRANTALSANDGQIELTYTPEVVEQLWQESKAT